MRLHESCLTIENHRVTELRNVNLIPCSTEYNVTLEDLVFKCSSETTFRGIFLYWFLNLSTNTRNCSDLSTLELCHFKLRVKHTLNESSIFMDLEWLSYQLQLLQDLELSVKFYYYSCNANSEMRNIVTIRILELLHSDESCAYCICWAIEGSIAIPKLRSILYHSHTLILILCTEYWY
jgi:hypothetical protein